VDPSRGFRIFNCSAFNVPPVIWMVLRVWLEWSRSGGGDDNAPSTFAV
jgi:hypothetical protein